MERHNPQRHTMLTDDAVAELMAKEASEASIKYSSLGLDAFKSTKPSNKAKPNTRFLGRIIKETTSHNAALLAKEAAEAQARLDDLTELEDKKRRKFNPSNVDIRRRQLGDISSILQGRKRNKGAENHGESKHKDGERNKDRSRERDHRHSRHGARQDAKEEEPRSHRKTEDERHRRRGRSSSPSHKDRRYRNRSPLSSEDEEERPRHSRSRHGKSGKGHDLISGDSSKRRSYGRLADDDDSRSNSSRPGKSTKGREDESDPLEDLIGPAPPPKSAVRTRGRGAIRGTAAMDGRFSEDYDPASDAQPEPAETDDWDEAVETFRDRQKWKQQGAERLRAAGFTDEQVKKWEKGGERDIDDVRWSKAGEKREWDRGKDDTEL